MFGKLEEFKQPEQTPEEKAFTAGYMACEKQYHDDLIEQGIRNDFEYHFDFAYDRYIAAMAEYFLKDDEKHV